MKQSSLHGVSTLRKRAARMGKSVFRFIHNTGRTAGQAPGTVVYTGRERQEPVTIDVIDYDEQEVRESRDASVEDALAYRDSKTVTWINVNGIHDTDIIRTIGGHYGLHPLSMEAVADPNGRPKLEEFDDYHFLVMKMLSVDAEGGMHREQVSLAAGRRFVISFQEEPGDVFGPVRGRIRGAVGRIRRMGNDYLAYALIDALIDNYFTVLERQGDLLEELDERIWRDADEGALHEGHRIKRDLTVIRKSVWPLRDMLGTMVRGESKLIRRETLVFIRDAHDHAVQAIDTTETYREMVSGLLDLYMTMVSGRMNDIMKVLTVIATIFIPLTFIAGIYGMNFEAMPELKLRWAYPAVWGVMLALGAGMVWWFKKKKWF